MNNAISPPKIYALVVAAGVGRRFGTNLPKQYTQIHGKTVLQYSVAAIRAIKNLEKLTLVISAEDTLAKTLNFAMPVDFVIGGAERMHSVYHGVQAIWENCAVENHQSAWVLIHDAARPCVNSDDIEKLITHVLQSEQGSEAGGILAVPVRDTVKYSHRIDGQNFSQKTLDRTTLWLAQTPQLFPLEPLYYFLQQAIKQAIPFTDEASLFEHFGKQPLLLEGNHSNIKLTFPEDLLFAESYLKNK